MTTRLMTIIAIGIFAVAALLAFSIIQSDRQQAAVIRAVNAVEYQTCQTAPRVVADSGGIYPPGQPRVSLRQAPLTGC